MSTVNNATSTSAADIYEKIGGKKETTTSTSSVEDLENRFLTLLMTQIKNQDPLNPLDNAQVTSQLAQLNMVNGIEKLNSTMTQLLDGYAETQAMQAAGIIGKNVMVAGNNLPLANGAGYAAVSLAADADQVVVKIKDAAGKVVQTQQLEDQPAGVFYFGWDGKDADGNQLADGKYTYTVSAVANGKDVEATAMQIGTVSAVTRSGSGFLLDLGELGSTAFDDVQRIL